MDESTPGTLEEGTPAPDATAGVTDTPEPGTGSDQAAQENWEKRYADAQSWGTKLAQENATLKAQAELVNDLQSDDPAAQQRALEALGLSYADEPEPTYDDPQDALAARLEKLEQQLQQRDATDQQQSELHRIETYVEATLKTLPDLDPDDHGWVVDKAVALPPKRLEDGSMVPDLQAAYEALVARDTARMKKWATSKKAPHIGQVGQAGTQALSENATHQQRVDWALERLRADE